MLLLSSLYKIRACCHFKMLFIVCNKLMKKKTIMKKLFDEFLQRPILKSVSFQLVYAVNCRNQRRLTRSENLL